MKKNIDYYPHKSEAHRHPKFRMLRSLYGTIEAGWAAEGRFWALNNLIAQSEDCVLNLSKKRNLGVFADELGMSVEEFSAFISILSGEDVELLTEISPNIYTTETVKETYNSVLNERKRAKEKYEKSKKTVKNTTSTEKDEFSTEKTETSTENLYKVNRSEVNRSELNKSEVNGKNPTFFNSHFETIKNLYAQHTKISDPNIKTHVAPIAEFYKRKPKDLSESEVTEIITQAFKSLKSEGVRVDFLKSGIQARISAKWEEKLDKMKENERKEAEMHRKEREKAQRETEWDEKTKLISRYRTFYEKNSLEFTSREQKEILRLLNEKKILQLGSIIEPKIEQLELKESD